MFKSLVSLIANTFVINVKLNLTAVILDGSKARLTHDAFEHHATRHFDLDILFSKLLFAELSIMRMKISRMMARYKVVRVGNTV